MTTWSDFINDLHTQHAARIGMRARFPRVQRSSARRGGGRLLGFRYEFADGSCASVDVERGWSCGCGGDVDGVCVHVWMIVRDQTAFGPVGAQGPSPPVTPRRPRRVVATMADVGRAAVAFGGDTLLHRILGRPCVEKMCRAFERVQSVAWRHDVCTAVFEAQSVPGTYNVSVRLSESMAVLTRLCACGDFAPSQWLGRETERGTPRRRCEAAKDGRGCLQGRSHRLCLA